MAKAGEWDHLQKIISSSYLSGVPLPAIMEKMATEHNFAKSARSYRSMFRKWGITKDQSKGGSNTTKTRGRINKLYKQTPTSSLSQSSAQRRQCRSRKSKESLEIGSGQEICSVNRDCVAKEPSPRAHAESLLNQLMEACDSPTWNGVSTVAHHLREYHFCVGTYSVLHAAARYAHGKIDHCLDVLQSIIGYMANKSVPLDLSDEEGLTAVDIAARNGNLRHWKMLLDSKAGPCQPLTSLLPSAPSETFTLLWQSLLSNSGQTLDGVKTISPSDKSPFTTLAQGFEGTHRQRQDHDCLQVRLLEAAGLLLYNGLEITSKTEQSILETFVSCCRSSDNARAMIDGSKLMLERLLQKGLDPTRHIDDSGYSLMHVACFHAPNRVLADTIIRHSSLKRNATAMVCCLLNGCTHPNSSHIPVNELLKSLLMSPAILDEAFSPFLYILKHCRESEHATYLNTFLTQRFSLCQVKNDAEAWEILGEIAGRLMARRHGLANVNVGPYQTTNVDYQLAELLLLPRKEPVSIVLNQALQNLRTMIEDPSIVGQNMEWSMSRKVFEGKWKGVKNFQEPFRCFLHVATKMLVQEMQDNSYVSLDPGKTLLRVLWLRREYQLPELMIPNDLLITVLANTAVPMLEQGLISSSGYGLLYGSHGWS